MQKKSKIAISLDSGLINLIDSYVDGVQIRSRSQAIESLLKNAIKETPMDTAVLLVNPKDVDILFKKFEGFYLIQHHLNFLLQNRFKNLFVITKKENRLIDFLKDVTKINIKIINQEKPEGTAIALNLIKNELKGNFVVINGDTLNEFELKKMFLEHLEGSKLITMGLISSPKPGSYGSVTLDGNNVIEFSEKKKNQSNIINAGIYLMKHNIFDFFDKKTKSLELDLFPKLAKINQIRGFFTYGKYTHFG